jgi:hypothetical protein
MITRQVVYSLPNNPTSRYGLRAQFSGGRATARRRKPRSRFIHNWWTKVMIILAWITDEFFELTVFKPLLTPVLSRFLHNLKTTLHTRGFGGAISLVKERRQDFLRFLAAPSEEQEAMKRGYFGRFWGTPLLSEVQTFQGANPEAVRLLRVVLTVLSALRSATLPPKFNLAPIASGFKASTPAAYAAFMDELDQFGTYCDYFWRSLGVEECA